MSELRNRLYKVKDFEELKYLAVFGQLKGTGTNPDISYKIILGDSPNLSADTDTEIWPQTGDMASPAAAETLSIVSSSIQDDNGGSGMDAVFIEGLDSDYLPQSELVILNGTGAVTSVNSYIHVAEINCLNITTSGTTNAGNITITNSSSGDNLGYVLAGDSLSKHAQFVVPAGYNALLLETTASCFRTSGSGEKRCEVDLIVTPLDGGAGDRVIYKTIKTGVSSSATSEVKYELPLVFGQKVFIHPHVNAETNNTKATFQYELILVKTTIDIDSVF